MDSIVHTAHGAIITSFITDNPYLIATGGFIGFLPDLIGELDKIIHKDDNTWKYYNFVHKISWKNPLIYFPQSLIHILIDKPVHTEKCHWWRKGCRRWNVLSWVVVIVYLLLKWVV